jgi:hypothetical protein
LVGSALLIAITLTVAGEGTTSGGEYTADNRLEDSVPQAEPLQAAPLKLQPTAEFAVPVTLAVNSWVPMVGTAALVGLILIRTTRAAIIATLAEADFVGSATLVAVTVATAGEGTFAGGAYSPLAEIVPHAGPSQPTPVTVQVTAVFDVPVTFPRNCWALPTVIVALFGLTVIATGVAVTVRVAALLVALPRLLLTTTVNSVPLSEFAVVEMV